MTETARRAFLVEYDSGVSQAERSMARKADTVTPIAMRTGDDLITNRVTLQEYSDGRLAASASALGISATWACVNLLAGTIASLPLMVYRTTGGVRDVAKDHPLYRVLHDSPNADQTAVDFWEFMQASIELHGNAYAEKASSGARVVALTPIPPDLVTVRRLSNGSLQYEWTENNTRSVVSQDRMLHIRGAGGSPLGGASTLSVCRQAFSSAVAVERSSSAMFRNGARPSGVLSTDKPLNKDQRQTAEGLLQEKFVGAMNEGRPMLLDNGLTWTQLSIKPVDAEMLESRKFSGEEICRIFGVPPAMVGYGDKASNWGTGKEVDVLGFQKFTLRRRLKRIEQALEKQLLTPQDRAAGVTIEFNLEGLLRGDSAARADYYKAALGNTQEPGWMVRNEVRRLENLPPVEGWDEPVRLISDQEDGGNGGSSPPAAPPV